MTPSTSWRDGDLDNDFVSLLALNIHTVNGIRDELTEHGGSLGPTGRACVEKTKKLDTRERRDCGCRGPALAICARHTPGKRAVKISGRKSERDDDHNFDDVHTVTRF